MENTVKIKVSRELIDFIRFISKEQNLTMSHILRNALNEYKNKAYTSEKDKNDDYSRTVHVAEKDGFTVDEYQIYSDRISNEDLYTILKKLYDIV